MVENTAFKLFDVWWDDKKSEKGVPLVGAIPSSTVNNMATGAVVLTNDATAATVTAAIAPTNNAVTAVATAVAVATKEEPKNHLSQRASLLEQAATPLGLNYEGFGLGIRASMPKMPSFRVNY